MLQEEEGISKKKLDFEDTSMPNSPCSIPATPEDEQAQNKRRLGSGYQMAKLTLTEAKKRKGANLTRTGLPRWHNQSYMLFVSLRQHSEKTMSRTDLIKKALDFDKKISQERNLPRVFRGKTPMNSASAILTNNADHYFVSFRPDGSKSMHFRLSFEPSNFEKAYKEYKEWEERLIQTDWPLHFAENKTETVVENLQVINNNNSYYDFQTEYLTEFDAFLASRKRARLSLQKTITTITNDDNNDNNNNNNHAAADDDQINNNNNNDIQMNTDNEINNNNNNNNRRHSLREKDKSSFLDNDELKSYSSSSDCSRLPLKWSDIVTVLDNKLYAIRPLPENVPLGYYFGVPMTEDEFDCIKDGVGQASNFAMMYQRTVLDATDNDGVVYKTKDQVTGQSVPLCPFHYIQETGDPERANILFLEGMVLNQIICWTKRSIVPGEQLFVYNNKELHEPGGNGKAYVDTLLDTSSTS